MQPRVTNRKTGRQDAAEERALVERARAGDGAAFDQLVRAHFARVHSLLYRMVGNYEDAEDLAQECFVRSHGALSLYRGEGSFSTWLYRIALHLSRDHHRAAGRRAGALGFDVQEAAETAAVARAARTGRGPADDAARRELCAELQAAIGRLPHRLRAAFVLRTFETLEYDAIARVLRITPGTARVHVMKARRLLLRRLEPWIGGAGS